MPALNAVMFDPTDFVDDNLRLILCEACNSEGRTFKRVSVYEHGCGFPHDDIADDGPCPHCEGSGYALVEVEPIGIEDLEVHHPDPKAELFAVLLRSAQRAEQIIGAEVDAVRNGRPHTALRRRLSPDAREGWAEFAAIADQMV